MNKLRRLHLLALICSFGAVSVHAQERVDGAIQKRGLFNQARASVGFKPGATVAAGNPNDHASFVEYWGPNSGGFPAYAHLQKPVYLDRVFWTGSDDASAADSALVADPQAFEVAANEVIGIAVPGLVGVMAAAR